MREADVFSVAVKAGPARFVPLILAARPVGPSLLIFSH